MFTGIVEGIGKVEKISKNTKNRSAIQMTVNLGKHAKGLKIGQSVALNGVCLTTTKLSKSCRLKVLTFSTLTGLELHPTITINDRSAKIFLYILYL